VEWNEVSVETTYICLIAFVHMYYFVSLRRLKHGDVWVGKLLWPT
jgi:hypothetical protein